MHRALIAIALALVLQIASSRASASSVNVRYQQGTGHGFLGLRTMDGVLLASGEQVQIARNNRITKRLTFHFKDGSIDDETTVFSQGGVLRLISYHHVQKGPSFPRPVDLTIDPQTGHV